MLRVSCDVAIGYSICGRGDSDVVTASTPPVSPRPRRRRWAVLVFLLLVLIVAAVSLRVASRPDRVADLILQQVGNALGLEITASGPAEYRVRGVPQLVVRGVIARQPGTPVPVLTADRILLSLPWSTVRARGADLTVRRVELDAPVIDLAALQRWQATRPPSKETRIPTLTDGLGVTGGRIVGGGWSIDGLAVDLPSLHPERKVSAHVLGTFRNSSLRVPLDLRVALARPSLDAGLAAVGTATPTSKDWTLTLDLAMSGRLHDGDDGLGLDAMRFGARARLAMGDSIYPFAIGVGGPLRYRTPTLWIAPMGLAIRGVGAIPTLDARGRLAFDSTLALDLDGRLTQWPDAWPALPPPIGQSTSPLPFTLEYAGPVDLSGRTELQLKRDATRFDARFRLPQVTQWIDAKSSDTPLPPLDGTLSTPKLVIAGATLERVEVTFDDGVDGDGVDE